MRWIFFRDVFGDWRWEHLDDTGATVGESWQCFDSRRDAEIDAAGHGYVPDGSPVMELAQPDEKF